MEYMPALINQIAVFLILLALGYLMRKRNMINKAVTDGLLLLVSKLGLSAVTIINMQRTQYSPETFRTFVSVFVVFAISNLIGYAVVATALRKRPLSEVAVWLVGTGTSNIGFLGFPVITAVFGGQSAFCTAAGLLATNVVLFSLGAFLLSYTKRAETRSTFRDILAPLCNWVLIASILGFLLYLFSIRLPLPIYTAIELVSYTTTPLAMIAVGSMIATQSLKRLLMSRSLLWASLLKLLILPLLCFVVLYPIYPHKTILAIIVIGFAMPTGNSVPGLVQQHGRDAGFASEIVFHSTVMGMLTIPIVVWITTAPI